MRAARAFLRAPLRRCSAPRWTARSIRETSERCSSCAVPESPLETALSRRWKCVFTALVRRRFSERSRALRRIRFFCEAMLAIA